MIDKKIAGGMWSRDDLKVFLVISALSFIAKGAAAFRGFSIDDYSFSLGPSEWSAGHFLGQGRFFGALVSYLFVSIGVNLSDAYFAMAFVVIALQAALAVSIMRLVGYSSPLIAIIAGGLIVLHPYNAELLTFKHILPVYALAIVFVIIAIELMKTRSKGVYVNILIITAIAAALMTYQTILNYILVAAYGCLLMSSVSTNKCAQSEFDPVYSRSNGWILILLSSFGALLFLASLSAAKKFGLVGKLSGRESFIGFSDVSGRFDQIITTLNLMFLKSEPVFPISLKVIYFSLVLGSAVLILLAIFRIKKGLLNFGLCLFLLGILPFLSIGIVMPLNEWWPVPRIIAHSSLLFGLIFLIAERSATQYVVNNFKSIFIIAGSLLLIGFVFINNQIFADQQTMVQWDRFKANRIVSRLEENPEFNSAKRLYVSEGKWGYPVALRTLQGDMNLSAFFPAWSRRPLILESTGYNLGRPSDVDIETGKRLCSDRGVWPSKDSVFIHGELAVVCLEK